MLGDFYWYSFQIDEKHVFSLYVYIYIADSTEMQKKMHTLRFWMSRFIFVTVFEQFKSCNKMSTSTEFDTVVKQVYGQRNVKTDKTHVYTFIPFLSVAR